LHYSLIEACCNRLLLDICAGSSTPPSGIAPGQSPARGTSGATWQASTRPARHRVPHDAYGILGLLQAHIDCRAIVADFVLGSRADTTQQEVS
jgi:hypothetical protein